MARKPPGPAAVYRKLMEASIRRSKRKIASGEYGDHVKALAEETHRILKDLSFAVRPYIHGNKAREKVASALDDIGVAHKCRIYWINNVPIRDPQVSGALMLAQARNLKAEMESLRKQGLDSQADAKKALLAHLLKPSGHAEKGAEYDVSNVIHPIINDAQAYRLGGLPTQAHDVVFHALANIVSEQREGKKYATSLANNLKFLMSQRR